MADIIPLNNKLQLAKEKQTALIRRRKILAVQKIFHCTHCASKCAKCGTQITMDHHQRERERNLRVPYRFCETCSQEYVQYIERLKGGGDPDCYWHNEDWLYVWRSWIEYQSAVDRYLKSKEFMQLLSELKPPKPEK